MNTITTILIFVIGFFIGQIFFHPGLYRAYREVARQMETVGEQKEMVIAAESY